MRISSWLQQSGIIEANIKEALELTIDELFTNCPQNSSKNSIRESLKNIIKRDKGFHEIFTAHAKIFMWFEESESSKSKSSKKSDKKSELSKKTKSPKKSAVFNKA